MCYEIKCRKFLMDFLKEHRDSPSIKIRLINRKIHRIEQTFPNMVCVDFSQKSLSSLINASDGNLSWKERTLFYKEGFFKDDEPDDDLPSNLQSKYHELIKEN